MDSNSKKLMTIAETAAYLNVKISKVRSMVFKKQINFYKIGALIRFDVEDLLSWLKSKKTGNN